MSRQPRVSPQSPDPSNDESNQPDAESDRVQSGDDAPTKRQPLPIEQIEDEEDDAKGG